MTAEVGGFNHCDVCRAGGRCAEVADAQIRHNQGRFKLCDVCDAPRPMDPARAKDHDEQWCRPTPTPTQLRVALRRELRGELVDLVRADMAAPRYGGGLPSSAFQLGLLVAAAIVAGERRNIGF